MAGLGEWPPTYGSKSCSITIEWPRFKTCPIPRQLKGFPDLLFYKVEDCYVATYYVGTEWKLEVLCGEWPPLEFACAFECRTDESRKAGMDDFVGCTEDDLRLLMRVGATIDSRGFVRPDLLGELPAFAKFVLNVDTSGLESS